ncbi:MAG: phosphate/phosphite/phosphonate ABC transporter substrate-binding protein [Rhodospirillales bacterium]
MSRRSAFWAALIGPCLALAPVSPCPDRPADAAGGVYTFGVVPQQSAMRLVQLWGPVMNYLSRETGLTLRFKTEKNIPAFEMALAGGAYDFAYMNPYHFTVFNRAPGYRALAHQADKRLKGVITVRKDSPAQSLSDLAGETLAFPAPAAFAASVLTRAHLTGEKIPFKAKYVSSHDSVYRSVAQGLYPAGGGTECTLNSVAPEVRAQLRILWRTDSFTPHAFAAHPGVPAEAAEAVRRALVEMNQSEEGRALLEPLKFKGVVSAGDEAWDDVRALGIDVLNHLVSDQGP